MRNRPTSCSILVGYRCNFNCAHCGVSEKRQVSLTEEEIHLLIRAINTYQFQSLLFVGGEPTLYIDKINTILSGIKYAPFPQIKITTNGHFARTEAAALTVLNEFRALSGVQLSYDRFHKAFQKEANLSNLYSACRRSGRSFNVLMTVQTPMDLLLIKDLKKMGDFPVGVQPIHPIGAAQKNKLQHIYPSFDADVLQKKCPNNNKLIYLPGEGFTTCCSHLALDGDGRGYVHPTLAGHLGSEFYSIMRKKTFQELIEYFKIPSPKFSPQHSAPCAMCKYLFSLRAKGRKTLAALST
ncbi:MAG TPA: radical SAM protein [Elusimicrobiales bacterium]|nr:radical SAM protein [Elusimicrobiales bacterium]